MDELLRKYNELEAAVDKRLTALVVHAYTAPIVVGIALVVLFVIFGAATAE